MKRLRLSQPSQLVGYLKDPIIKNTILMVAGNGLMAVFGFLFWMIAARSYSTEAVGLAIALISATFLIAVLSRLGLDVAIVKFLPEEKEKGDMLNTCLTIAGLTSLVLSLIFIAVVKLWAPDLVFIQENVGYALVFVVFTLISTISQIQNNAFIAFGAAGLAFWRCTITGLRIPLLISLSAFGAIGIFSGWGAGICLATIAGIGFTIKLQTGYRLVPLIRRGIATNMLSFSFGNYIAEILRESPQRILPLLIVSILGPTMGAYFGIAWAISSMLFIIPHMAGFVLIAESSFPSERILPLFIRAVKLILVLSVPGILTLVFLAKPILSLFGSGYSQNSLWLLRILAFSSLPLAINILYITIDRIRKRIKSSILVYLSIFVFTLVGSYILMKEMQVIGVGIAWLGANLVLSLILSSKMLKMSGISWKVLLSRSHR